MGASILDLERDSRSASLLGNDVPSFRQQLWSRFRCAGGGLLMLALTMAAVRQFLGSASRPATEQGVALPMQHIAGNESLDSRPCTAGIALSDWEPFKCNEPEGHMTVHVVNGSQKGLAVDDTTWNACSDRIPVHWPAASQSARGGVQTLHMFQAYSWNMQRHPAWWENLRRYVDHTGGKVLLGTRVSVIKSDDDKDWHGIQCLLRMLGTEKVLGIALGNEDDLVAQYAQEPAKQYFWGNMTQRIRERVEDLKTMDGGRFRKVPVTTIFSEHALITPSGHEWDADTVAEPATIRMKPEIEEVLAEIATLPDNYVFSFNCYSYFTPCPPVEMSCSEWQRRATCFDDPNCITLQRLRGMRLVIEEFRKRHGLARSTEMAPLWIGEMGWSSPGAATNANNCCETWSDMELFKTFYRNFLGWNMSIGEGLAPPEQVFYFTIRDAALFGQSEHFGLVGGTMKAHADRSPETLEELHAFCRNSTCKI